jgi:MFS family permease
LLGAVATVGLGYGASSIALAATFIGLIGVFMGLGTGGAIALAATIYPTPIRSTGAGWGMAMGRFGQIIGPLIAGVLLGAGWTAGPIMTVIACGATTSRTSCANYNLAHRTSIDEGERSMKAVRFDRYGDIEVLHLVDVPVPEPAQGQVLVKVKAASINPGEAKIREGCSTRFGLPVFHPARVATWPGS